MEKTIELVEIVENELFKKIMQYIKKVGADAFFDSRFTGEFNYQHLLTVGKNAFRNSNFTGTINVPSCRYIGDYAFGLSSFSKITIGANVKLGADCIGYYSDEFINTYIANGRQTGTYVWSGWKKIE